MAMSSVTFGLARWDAYSREDLDALRGELDTQERNGMPWRMLDGSSIAWETLLATPAEPGKWQWTLPYEPNAWKLEFAVYLAFARGNYSLTPGSRVDILPFRKSDETNDNPDIITTRDGREWKIVMTDWMRGWLREYGYQVELPAARATFAADPQGRAPTLDVPWFLGALDATLAECEARQLPFRIQW